MHDIKDSSHENRHTFLCFGGLDWWYQHRSHVDFQLTRRFAEKGKTLYVNSIVMQKANFRQGKKFWQKVARKLKSISMGLKMTDAGFWVYSPFSLPVHHIPWARVVNETLVRLQVKSVSRKLGLLKPLVMVVCPAACEVALKMKPAKMIYLRTDAYELFQNVDFEVIKKCDRTLKEKSDLTLFVSERLYRKEAHQCKRAIYLDHGVDYDMFASMGNDFVIPSDIANIKNPIIGFFGTLDSHTVDVDLVARVADQLSDMSFVFVGKIARRYPVLVEKRNVWLLGQKAYEEVPFYGKCFDVAIMPWQSTDWIAACNPVKLKEYLALGLPIVSTPFAELDKYHDVVYKAETTVEFAECIKKALAEDNLERIGARKKKVESATWDSKAGLVLQELFGRDHDFQKSD